MKITLAFTIFNKEKWVKSLLKSWVTNLSGKNRYEIIIVFDACKDDSEKIAEEYLSKTGIKYKFFHANDKYEIYCNNLALRHATGDYVVFIQDDNWIYTKNWDLILSDTIKKVPDIGAVGFLSGIRIETPKTFLHKLFPRQKDIFYERIEIDRPHKGKYFNKKLARYKMGIWQVDAINRPFCISRKLLLSQGGLNRKFMPTCGDDLDLSIKLLRKNKKNIYIPFDLLNTTSSDNTISKDLIRDVYIKAYALNFKLHKNFLFRDHISKVAKILDW